ncbi:MAG TPA: type 1 glutamine amidotransferase [Jatrophihabitantaceae bacterium]
MTPLVLVLQLDPTDPPARLGQWLRDAGVELDVRALDAGEQLPTDLSPYQGVVVLGGWMGALDDDVAPFLPDVRALLRQTVADEVPTLGVCLGHQLLAVAHGGQVRVHPDGPEVGALLVAKRAAGGTDPLFGTLPITPDVIQWHSDEVHVLPPGAIQLYSSPHTDYQAFRLGRLAWGIQFHIENSAEMIREWAAQREENLAHYDIDAIADRAIGLLDDIEEVWRPFAAVFADIVRNPDAVRPARGVPTTTAAPITDPAAIRAALAAELTSSRASLPMPGVRPPDET